MEHAKAFPILDTAGRLGLAPEDLFLFGGEMAKVDPAVLRRPRTRPGTPRLVLVSAITPTAAGEGKTTTSIGLVQALTRLGESACLSLREPSLGPVFGMKGGGTGGGKSEVVPPDRINLHFTGDFHAITAAHNLLAAMLDNHVFQDNDLRLDPRRILWKRVLDMNDRSLRHVVIGLGGSKQGVPRETGFDITAASEVMAILCLAEDEADLRARLDRTLVAFTYDGEPVTAGRLGATGAMMALLRDALWPNLVRTTEGAPALVHGGPFANIAHGCSSVLATRMALHLADWAVTEAGFGFDLGAEKFFDIKLRATGLDTAAVVLVATIRALKSHGDVKPADLGKPDPAAVARGFPNMEKHLENVRQFCETPVVALNLFPTDTPEEIDAVRRRAAELGVPFAASAHFARGGEGAEDLARAVMANAEKVSRPFCPLYPLEAPAKEKIETVARKMYGAKSVYFTKDAERDLREIAKLGYDRLPVCMAKTQSSLTDDPRRRGRPEDFEITVEEVQANAGAGFLVVLTGEIIRMPGLPKVSRAEAINLVDGRITGL
jgi:formate--tetrahydrofolate ligase